MATTEQPSWPSPLLYFCHGEGSLIVVNRPRHLPSLDGYPYDGDDLINADRLFASFARCRFACDDNSPHHCRDWPYYFFVMPHAQFALRLIHYYDRRVGDCYTVPWLPHLQLKKYAYGVYGFQDGVSVGQGTLMIGGKHKLVANFNNGMLNHYDNGDYSVNFGPQGDPRCSVKLVGDVRIVGTFVAVNSHFPTNRPKSLQCEFVVTKADTDQLLAKTMFHVGLNQLQDIPEPSAFTASVEYYDVAGNMLKFAAAGGGANFFRCWAAGDTAAAYTLMEISDAEYESMRAMLRGRCIWPGIAVAVLGS